MQRFQDKRIFYCKACTATKTGWKRDDRLVHSCCHCHISPSCLGASRGSRIAHFNQSHYGPKAAHPSHPQGGALPANTRGTKHKVCHFLLVWKHLGHLCCFPYWQPGKLQGSPVHRDAHGILVSVLYISWWHQVGSDGGTVWVMDSQPCWALQHWEGHKGTQGGKQAGQEVWWTVPSISTTKVWLLWPNASSGNVHKYVCSLPRLRHQLKPHKCYLNPSAYKCLCLLSISISLHLTLP